MNDHVFDILGVGTREDSYTDLVAYAFENHEIFRRKFLENLAEKRPCIQGIKEQREWKVEKRLPVECPKDCISSTENKCSRKKAVPDILIFGKNIRNIILIENKILSEEAGGQTEMYACEVLQKLMAEKLEVEDPQFHCYFLSLSGEKAKSDTFVSISYSDVVKCIPDELGDTNLERLLSELRQRVEEYEKVDVPRNDEKLTHYMDPDENYRYGFVTSIRLLEKLCEPLKQELELKNLVNIYKGTPKIRGHGNAPCYLWSDACWSNILRSPDCCPSLHLELRWLEQDKTFELYVHLENVSCERTRKTFRERMREAKVKLKSGEWRWGKKSNSNTIATYKFKKELSYREFREELVRQLDYMLPLIKEALQTMEQPRSISIRNGAANRED
jgi:hypothetical protein